MRYFCTDDPFEIISAAEGGTLAHSLMEELGEDREMTKEVFLDRASKAFDEFISTNPPLIGKNVDQKMLQSKFYINNLIEEHLKLFVQRLRCYAL